MSRKIIPGRIKVVPKVIQIGNYTRPKWWMFWAWEQWNIMEEEVQNSYHVTFTQKRRVK